MPFGLEAECCGFGGGIVDGGGTGWFGGWVRVGHG